MSDPTSRRYHGERRCCALTSSPPFAAPREDRFTHIDATSGLTLHDDTDRFLLAAGGSRRWFFSTTGTVPLWDADFHDGDWLIFGSETHGIDRTLLAQHPDRVVRIPQAPGERCLNLSTAAGIALYEALRRLRPEIGEREDAKTRRLREGNSIQ